MCISNFVMTTGKFFSSRAFTIFFTFTATKKPKLYFRKLLHKHKVKLDKYGFPILLNSNIFKFITRSVTHRIAMKIFKRHCTEKF